MSDYRPTHRSGSHNAKYSNLFVMSETPKSLLQQARN